MFKKRVLGLSFLGKHPVPFMINLNGLTRRQQDAMIRHSAHHTNRHMEEMKKQMSAGKTFTQAHKIAMKKVGA